MVEKFRAVRQGLCVACSCRVLMCVGYDCRMADRNELLFQGKRLADRVSEAHEKIRKDVQKQYDEARRMSHVAVRDSQGYLKEWRIEVPELGALRAKVLGDEVQYTISLNGGDGRFFRFAPDDTPGVPRPRGVTYGNAVCLYVPNAGGAASIKEAIAVKFAEFNAWYDAVRAEVEEFHAQLQGFIQEVYAEQDEVEKQAKQLEDELNS